MKFIPLHSINAVIIYKNTIFSTAAVVVIVFLILSLTLPILFVSLLVPYTGIWGSHTLYEQPKIRYLFEHLFKANLHATATTTVAAGSSGARNNIGTLICSNVPMLRDTLGIYSINECSTFKYWSEDHNSDGLMDRLYFRQHLETAVVNNISNIEWILSLQADMKEKCQLSPPALIMVNFDVPKHEKWRGGGLLFIQSELDFHQYDDFNCPILNSKASTEFHGISLNQNQLSQQLDTDEIQKRYKRFTLIQQLQMNPGYFKGKLVEKDFERGPMVNGLHIQWNIKISPVGIRYHLNIWERLTQFWLYFASFFGFSFWFINYVKDYLFSKHIIGSWEIAPWKKLH